LPRIALIRQHLFPQPCVLLNQLFILDLGARLLCSPPPQKSSDSSEHQKEAHKKAPEGAIFSSFPNASA
jgi:hypothetical protein